MGLGAPKRRNKLSHDPNNTAWSRSTTGYGHKILSSQGWRPGDYLGLKDATHSAHYTAANASHIRVSLREDNLGLGAKIGKSNAETFGLSLFSGVLGRLNGKSDADVQKHQLALRDAELRTYQAQKHGSMNFVSGGFLVGDKMELVDEKNKKGFIKVPEESSSSCRSHLTKKRKAEDEVVEAGLTNPSNSRRETPHDGLITTSLRSEGDKPSQKVRKSKVAKSQAVNETSHGQVLREAILQQYGQGTDNDLAASNPFSKVESIPSVKKPDKKPKKKTRRTIEVREDPTLVETRCEKIRSKAEKRARKEQRRKKKEEKRRLKSENPVTSSESPSQVQSDSSAKAPEAAVSHQTFSGSRHAVRQRYIQQKRMASMDPQAMKEIFMLKAAG